MTDQDTAMEAVRVERRRLSRDLHDGVAQDLVAVGYLLDGIAADGDATSMAADVDEARRRITQVRAELRRLIHALRNDGEGPVPDPETPERELAAFAGETAQRAGLQVSLDVTATGRLPADTERELIRIGREAITNVARHAGAQRLWLTVDIRPPAARVVVADDGDGPATAPAGTAAEGSGLAIMAERAERIGATVRIGERPGGGMLVTVFTGEEPDDDGGDLRTVGRRP